MPFGSATRHGVALLLTDPLVEQLLPGRVVRRDGGGAGRVGRDVQRRGDRDRALGRLAARGHRQQGRGLLRG